jgi:glycosyltransferase involved in cell wall biosynthesis
MQGTLYRIGKASRSRATGPPVGLSVTIYMHDFSGGGVERQTLLLARELQANGLTVSVLLHQARGELRDIVPVDLRVVDLNSHRTLQDIPLIARFLRRDRPDVLVANVDHNNIAAVLGNLLAGKQTKVIICQHNPISAPYFRNLHWSYRMIPLAYCLLSPYFSGAVAVSEGLAGELHSIAHIPQRKIALIHNPIIGPDFELRADQPVAHPWFGHSETPIFVTAGRLVAMKDHATLLRALAIHRRQQPSRLLILGAGPLREWLGTLTDELGLHDAVDFLGFQENPLPYFRRADAFVLSSYTEGFGNVLVESMACGTPVISTDCRHGPAEILDLGRYGVLVAPRSAQALASAMDRVADMRRRWPPMLLKARAAEFSTAACAAKYIRLFHSLELKPAGKEAR